MSDIEKEIIEQSKELFGKAYDDLAHPSAKSVGNTLSLLPRTVGGLAWQLGKMDNKRRGEYKAYYSGGT